MPRRRRSRGAGASLREASTAAHSFWFQDRSRAGRRPDHRMVGIEASGEGGRGSVWVNPFSRAPNGSVFDAERTGTVATILPPARSATRRLAQHVLFGVAAVG